MNRRSFLQSILAAGVAPAFVRNPMKLWVPRDVTNYLYTHESDWVIGRSGPPERMGVIGDFSNTLYEGEIIETDAVVSVTQGSFDVFAALLKKCLEQPQPNTMLLNQKAETLYRQFMEEPNRERRIAMAQAPLLDHLRSRA